MLYFQFLKGQNKVGLREARANPRSGYLYWLSGANEKRNTLT